MTFVKGRSGNPAGRAVGSRNKLGEAFVDALYQDFQSGGLEAIVACREQKPDVYLTVISRVLPKTLDVNVKADFVHYLRTLNGNGTRPNGAIEAPVVEGQPGDVRH